MTVRNKTLYPGVLEVEEGKNRRAKQMAEEKERQSDFIGGAPNYDKFEGWTPEEVLSWLNID